MDRETEGVERERHRVFKNSSLCILVFPFVNHSRLHFLIFYQFLCSIFLTFLCLLCMRLFYQFSLSCYFICILGVIIPTSSILIYLFILLNVFASSCFFMSIYFPCYLPVPPCLFLSLSPLSTQHFSSFLTVFLSPPYLLTL